MEKMGTLKKMGTKWGPKTNFGLHGDQSPQMGTNVGAVKYAILTWLFSFSELSYQVLMVNIGSLSTGGRVIAVKADLAKIALTTPVCTEVLEKIALSRRCVIEQLNLNGEPLFLGSTSTGG